MATEVAPTNAKPPRRKLNFLAVNLALVALLGVFIAGFVLSLTPEIDGTVIAREVTPLQGHMGGSTAYILRGPDGVDRHYIADGAFNALPGNLLVGTTVEKHGWHSCLSAQRQADG